ncbi:MAG TPA: hypothetical protein PLO89_00970 [Spirochaetota bacterium]|nr:hypothetical protein [Spirochaetota bacterium]
MKKNFNENQKGAAICERLKAVVTALEYQASSIPDSLEYFDDKYLENSRKVLSYFAFNNYVSANNINTRTLKELTDKIVNGNDEVFKRVVQDNLKLLSDNFQSIQFFLEEITKFKKENYKFLIRFDIFPNLSKEFTEKLFRDNPEVYMKKLEEFIKTNSPDIEFNRMWAPEAIKDCYNLNDSDALEKLISSFLSDSEKQKLESAANSPREKLMKLIGNLASSKSVLDEIYSNFDHNFKLIRGREKSFSEKLQDVLRKIFNIANQDDFFQIEYINPANKKIQKDIIKIDEFMSSVKKKILLFSEISKPLSSVSGKIKKGTEEALFNFLEETYLSLLLMKERFMGLDTELRLNAPKNIRSKLREIKPSLDNLNKIVTGVGEHRRKFIVEQEHFFKNSK